MSINRIWNSSIKTMFHKLEHKRLDLHLTCPGVKFHKVRFPLLLEENALQFSSSYGPGTKVFSGLYYLFSYKLCFLSVRFW